METKETLFKSTASKNDLEHEIKAINNKFELTTLTIKRFNIGTLSNELLNDFRNLTILDVSNNGLSDFESGVLRPLRYLESINFSRNLIRSIDDTFFQMNSKLTKILLRNNLLSSINTNAFSKLEKLQILNLGRNCITIMSPHCLNCPQLEKLYLDNNIIEYVDPLAFYQLPTLTNLNLSSNRIQKLDCNLFSRSRQITILKLNDNVISESKMKFLFVLDELYVFHFRKNMITEIMTTYVALNKHHLTDLDLRFNNISNIEVLTFDGCPNLQFLKLTVNGFFAIDSIRNLTFLKEFELFYNAHSRLFLTRPFWDCIADKTKLVFLKLVLQYVDVINIGNFSKMNNLEYLHIECKEPNNILTDISFIIQFNNMRKLSVLTLKHLNHLTVHELEERYSFGTENLKYLNLTGIKNEFINDIFYNFLLLENLNLSFSEINEISDKAFEMLVHLKYLNLKYSKLKSIGSNLFIYNTELKIIDCAHCCIMKIEGYAFKNLKNLQILDLRHNILADVPEEAFAGVQPQIEIRLTTTI